MTGKTKAAGWQVGARRTLPLELAEAWDLLTRQPWLERWSGLSAGGADEPAVRSRAAERVMRVRTPSSLIQLRVLPAATGTTVAFHEEHLPDERTRVLRKNHWARVLDELELAVSAGSPPRSRHLDRDGHADHQGRSN